MKATIVKTENGYLVIIESPYAQSLFNGEKSYVAKTLDEALKLVKKEMA
jgi:hypothetical protein